MTTFKQFLLVEDGTRTSEINEQQALDFARQHCEQYLNNENWLFRGIPYTTKYLYGDSTHGKPRTSLEIPNYYTLIMDNLPSWQDVPKRSRSFICTTSPYRTGAYGTNYFVIVPDNIQVAIFDHDDIWSGFEQLRKELNIAPDTFAMMLEAMHRAFDTGYTAEQTQHDWNALIAHLQAVAKYGPEHVDRTLEEIQQQFPGMKTKTITQFYELLKLKGVVPTLEYLLDREHIEVHQANSLPHYAVPREAWFAGPAVFVKSTNQTLGPYDFAEQALPS